MKRSLNRLLALLLTMAMLLVYIPAPPAKAAVLDGLEYVIENGEVTITGHDMWSITPDLVIPDTIEGYPVTCIGEEAFKNSYTLTAITIGGNVTHICDSAFESCDGLTTVTIGDSGTSIGYSAFKSCSSLAAVTIGKGVTTIGNYAFSYCYDLTTVSIPDSVTSIWKDTFYSSNNLSYTQYENEKYLGNEQNPYHVLMGSTLATDEVESCSIHPQTKVIAGYAYYNCKMLSSGTMFPDGVVSIGENAFNGCVRMPYYGIPASVTSIGNGAFGNCSRIDEVEIPASVTHIGSDAFPDPVIFTVAEDNPVYSSDDFGVLYNKVEKSIVRAPETISGDYVVPDGITSIGDDIFNGCTGITSVTFGNSVTTIGEWAFSDCTGITSVTFGSSVTTIGKRAFSRCTGITSVTLPDSVTEIGEEAFYNCGNLTTVDIGDGVTTIGAGAFGNCSGITSVTIPAAVTSIGEDAFPRRTALSVDQDNPAYCIDASGVLYNKDKTVIIQVPTTISGDYIIPDGVTVIEDSMFAYCTGLTSVTIPASVTDIGNYAFRGCENLTQVTLLNLDASIGVEAFNGTAAAASYDSAYYLGVGDNPYYLLYDYVPAYRPASSCTIHPDTKIIGHNAFIDATALSTVTIPEGVTTIGEKAFYAGNVSTVNIPSTVTHIGDYAFYECNMDTVTIPQGVTGIGEGVFSHCYQLTAVTIPDSVTSLGFGVFDGCTGLTTVSIPDSVTAIGDAAFQGCTGLTAVSIPDSVTSLGFGVFHGCDSLQYNSYNNAKYLGNEQTPTILLVKAASETITGCEISEDTLVIDNYAFSNCASLTSITIPAGVTGIGYAAFEGCAGLKTITFEGDAPIIGDWAFGYTKEEDNEVVATAYYPLGNPTWTEDVMQDYCGVITWVAKDMWYLAPNMEYLEYTIENGKVTITNCDTAAKGTLAIPASIEGCPVTAIGGSAFSGCSNLTEITIPASVTSIGYQAFYECSSLTSIKIPDSVTVLGEGAFWNCTGMTSAVIGNGVTAIESMAFYSCNNLSDVTIGSSVTSIGENAFGHCYSLSEVTIPDSVTSIGKSAFYNCYTLTDVTLGNSVETIGMESFMFTGVRTIWLPASVRSIGVGAFDSSDLTAYQVAENNQNYSNDGQGALLNKGKDLLISFPPAATGSYTIPDSVVSILASAFESSELTSVTVPASVTHIGNCAFTCMNNLSTVYFLGDAPNICEDAFEYTYNVNAYYEENASGWTEDVMQNYGGNITWMTKPKSHGNLMYMIQNGNAVITGFVEMPEGELVIPAQIEGYPVTGILKNAFYGCYELTAVTIPESVTTIGDSAFGDCTGLTEVTLSEGVTTLGVYSFGGCTGLTGITLPDSLVTIGDSAFWGCSGLTGVTIPAGVTSMGIGAFGDCGSLTAISVAEGNTTYCSDGSGVVFTKDMKTLVMAPDAICGAYTIPNGVTGVAPNAFMYCSELTELTIPDSVTTVEGYAFMSCTGLTTVTISAGVTGLADGAFANCLSLGTVYFRGDAPTFGDGVFDMWEQPVNEYITAYYPTGNATWTEDVMYNCSDRISWVPYEVEVEPTGTTIMGSLKSFGDVEGLTVELWLEGAEAASYTAVIDGDSYSFTNVPAGSYTLKISKENGVTRTYPIEAGTASVSQDVAISPLGDVNGDTKVNIGDVARIYAHVRNTGKIEDEYALLCSDVTGDQRINIGDVARTYSHVKGTNPLW